MYGPEYDNVARPVVMKMLGIDGDRCPKCGVHLSEKSRLKMMSGGRVKCKACDFYGNWRYGTKLEGSRISNMQFIGLFFKRVLPNEVGAIAKQLNMDAATVREWFKRFDQAVADQ